MTGLMVQQHHQEHEYQVEHQRAEAYGEIIRRYRARYEAEYQRAEAYREMAGHLILKLESLKESIAAEGGRLMPASGLTIPMPKARYGHRRRQAISHDE